MTNSEQNIPALIVQIILAIIMLAVAFEITTADIKALPKMWKRLLLGYVMQITFLPAFMLLMLIVINPRINIVMAFLLLSACPGGNLSQLFVIRSKGNIGISMGLSFLSTLFSPITVGGIFYLATHANSAWIQAYKNLELPLGNILNTLITSIFIPLVIGIWMSSQAGAGWTRTRELIQKSVPWLLISLLIGASWSFRESLSGIDSLMLFMVMGISTGCFITAYFFTRLITRDYSTSVTIAWEVSIQNSGLGMVLGLVYFAHIPEVSLVCALWGIWQMVMGVIVSSLIGKFVHKYPIMNS
jgi:BASS family bile acid:Na+ symporter